MSGTMGDSIKNIMESARNNSDVEPPKKRPIGSEHLGQCESCRGNIKLIKFDDGSEKEFGCRCEFQQYAKEKQRKINAEIFDKASMISPKYRDITFDDFETVEDDQAYALKVSKRYAENFGEMMRKGQNLFFQGSTGTGKTHLASAIRNEVRSQNYKVFFLSLPVLVEEAKKEMNTSEVKKPIMKTAKDADLLIIDDVGANMMTKWELSELFKLVDARLGKCTIYTTNLTSADFTANIDIERIFSRMMENTARIILNGDDYRLRGIL